MPVEITDLLFPGGSVAAGAWLFYKLFVRADRREKDLWRKMKEQRDEYRMGKERAEHQLQACAHELALYHARYGPLED